VFFAGYDGVFHMGLRLPVGSGICAQIVTWVTIGELNDLSFIFTSFSQFLGLFDWGHNIF
jgi:hypothetical protein